jgi:hypothetical protein
VGPRAGLDGCEKSRLPRGFDSRTVQPVASRYTNSAIAAPMLEYGTLFILLCDRTSGIKRAVNVKTVFFIILKIFRFSDVW